MTLHVHHMIYIFCCQGLRSLTVTTRNEPCVVALLVSDAVVIGHETSPVLSNCQVSDTVVIGHETTPVLQHCIRISGNEAAFKEDISYESETLHTAAAGKPA